MKNNPVGSGCAVGTSKWAHCEHGGLDLGSGFRGTLCWLQQNRILEQAHSWISLENYKIVRNRKKPLQLALPLLAVGVSTLTRACWVTHFLPSLSMGWKAPCWERRRSGRQQGQPGVRHWVCEDGLAEGVLGHLFSKWGLGMSGDSVSTLYPQAPHLFAQLTVDWEQSGKKKISAYQTCSFSFTVIH